MHITLEADYAVRIVHCLAQNGGRMDAKRISERSCVTLRFALKILRKLVGGGVIKSFKGTQGGYELAKPAAEISLRDVIETVEGRYALSRCVCDEYECSQTPEGRCPFHTVYARISDEVREKLHEIKFDTPPGQGT
ncbi:MAG: Rrf2 family transcriptional regulator [Acetanaerobacterium sp.]